MKVLLTGGSGLFGRYLLTALERDGHDVVPVGLSAAPPVAPWVVCDLTDRSLTEKVFTDVSPDVVVHAAALTNVDLCEREPVLADRVNHGTTKTLAGLTDAAGARLVLVSTDSVFEGSRGHYVESDQVGPVNEYARSKLAAERALATHTDALIVRTNFFGRSRRGHGLVEWLLRELQSDNEIVGFSDVVFSPQYCGTAAELLSRLASSDVRGIVHLGAADQIDKYEFARLIADAFRLDRSLIREGRLAEVPLTAPRPHDTSLVVEHAEEVLGRAMPTVAEGVSALHAEQLVTPSLT